MGFDDLITRSSSTLLRVFENTRVDITLDGVLVKDDVPGILDLSPVVISPGNYEQVQLDAALSLSSDVLAGITSQHRFTTRGVIYRMGGKPRTDGHGLTYIPLTVQK